MYGGPPPTGVGIYAPPRRRSRAGWIIALVAVVVVIGGLWLLAFLVASGEGGGGASYYGDFDETVLEEGDADKVALIDVSGEILSTRGPAAGVAADEEIIDKLDQALRDDSVVSVIVRFNTPGGGVVASDNILRKVELVRGQKPVVSLMDDVAASGGYYIASGTNEIVANPSTITGSIGVIMIIPNLEGTAEKIGLKTVVIKSGPHKDIASPFRDLPADERAILQTLIDESYEQFVGIVAKGRKMEPERVKQLADGRIYTGKQAKELGLVDHLGGRDIALQRARSLGKSLDATLVRYESNLGLTDILGGFNTGSLRKLFEEEIRTELRPGLQYLWLP